MTRTTTQTLSVILSWTMVLPIGCHLPDDKNTTGDADPQSIALVTYDDAVARVHSEVYYTIDAVAWMDESLYYEDDEGLDLAIGELSYSADQLVLALAELEDLENTIQGRSAQEDGRIVQPLLFMIGAGVALYGFYKFGKAMKNLSNRATEARNRRDDAAVNLMNNVDGAEEAHQAAKDDLQAVGEEAVVEVTTKVTSDLILSPFNPKSVIQIFVKDKAGDLLQKGLKILSASTECASDETAVCPIAAGETDENGEVAVPAGNVAVVVSAPERTRAVVEEVTLVEDETTPVTVDMAPLAEEVIDMVGGADTADGPVDTGGDESVDTEWDTGTANDGPECTIFFACCDALEYDDYNYQRWIEFRDQCILNMFTRDETICQTYIDGYPEFCSR